MRNKLAARGQDQYCEHCGAAKGSLIVEGVYDGEQFNVIRTSQGLLCQYCAQLDTPRKNYHPITGASISHKKGRR